MQVNTDTLFICERLKQIDSSYFVIFKNGKYQLHSSEQLFNSYCLTFPFNELDERAVDFAMETRFNRARQLVEKLDKENELLEKKNQTEKLNQIREQIKEIK
ncbi:MAG: hypothetical protein RR140_03635 [Clostridia bacterium]